METLDITKGKTDAQTRAEIFKDLIPFIDYQAIAKQLWAIEELPKCSSPRYERDIILKLEDI